jgi:Zn-dependent protease
VEVQAVYRDDVSASRFARWLNASWPLFRAFGVDVRVHWTIVLVPLALFAMFARWNPLLLALELAGAWTGGLYLTVWIHEMGHIVTGRRLGAPSRTITLSPLGGLAHFESPMPSPRAEILTALAGPLTQAAFALLLAVPFLLLDLAALSGVNIWAGTYQRFIVFQLVMVGFNLLPSYPLDGGRALKGALSQRMHANKASLVASQVGFGGALFLLLAGLAVLVNWHQDETLWLVGGTTGGLILIGIAVSCFLACRHLQREARHVESPYEPAEAWKSGRGEEAWKDSIVESERISRAEERRERRAAEARRQEEAHRRKVKERVDQLLDRINELGGVDRLSPAERRELAEASELLRRETVER